MRFFPTFMVCLVTVAIAGCTAPPADAPQNASDASWKPFNLGTHHRAVTTRSAEAQLAFDQGLIWSYAFNHDEAMRAFGEAARLDPDLAMAYWGVALVNGPHINNPFVDEAHAKAAWEALAKAREHQASANEVERALIDALGARYAMPQPADRAPLDKAYAAAMKQVYERFPQDADVATLYAESLLDVHPWDQWTPEGVPKEGTEEILAVLEHAQQLDPNHPGALHLWVHSFEASSHPERAEHAADVLRTLVPDASHLVHMPAHIDMRLGKWTQAAATNEAAMAADERYMARKPQLGFYALYMAHNVHFLAFTAMMQGRSETAIQLCDRVVRDFPPEAVRENPLFLDAFQTVGLEARKRFGHWDEILATPPFPPDFPVATAFWHFSRGVAFASTGRIDEALEERKAFVAALPAIPDEAYWGSNLAKNVLAPAVPYLDGEIAYRRGRLDEAIADLTKAVVLEDELKFDDPPPWTTPSRHTLGAVLLEAGRPREAEAVYRTDLARFPENAWALSGLAKALAASGKNGEAKAVEERFQTAWARADIPMGASCLCVDRAHTAGS